MACKMVNSLIFSPCAIYVNLGVQKYFDGSLLVICHKHLF
jgi:hypothetical protein